MRNWKKVVATSALALTIISPMSVFAETSTDQAQNTTQDANKPGAIQQGEEFFVPRGHKFLKVGVGARLMGVGVHQQEYLLLLAEKYAPETKSEWEALFAERNQLLEEIKSDLKSKLTDQNKEEIKIWKEQAKSRLQDLDKSKLPDLDEKKEIFQTFTEAVKSGDAEQIKASLNQLLANFKEQNELLSKRAEELKQQSSQ